MHQGQLVFAQLMRHLPLTGPVLVGTPASTKKESIMASRRKLYTAEFQRQMVDLVRSGRKPGELFRESGRTSWTIRKWSQQAGRDAQRSDAGLTTSEREDLGARQPALPRPKPTTRCPWPARAKVHAARPSPRERKSQEQRSKAHS